MGGCPNEDAPEHRSRMSGEEGRTRKLLGIIDEPSSRLRKFLSRRGHEPRVRIRWDGIGRVFESLRRATEWGRRPESDSAQSKRSTTGCLNTENVETSLTGLMNARCIRRLIEAHGIEAACCDHGVLLRFWRQRQPIHLRLHTAVNISEFRSLDTPRASNPIKGG